MRKAFVMVLLMLIIVPAVVGDKCIQRMEDGYPSDSYNVEAFNDGECTVSNIDELLELCSNGDCDSEKFIQALINEDNKDTLSEDFKKVLTDDSKREIVLKHLNGVGCKNEGNLCKQIINFLSEKKKPIKTDAEKKLVANYAKTKGFNLDLSNAPDGLYVNAQNQLILSVGANKIQLYPNGNVEKIIANKDGTFTVKYKGGSKNVKLSGEVAVFGHKISGGKGNSLWSVNFPKDNKNLPNLHILGIDGAIHFGKNTFFIEGKDVTISNDGITILPRENNNILSLCSEFLKATFKTSNNCITAKVTGLYVALRSTAHNGETSVDAISIYAKSGLPSFKLGKTTLLGSFTRNGFSGELRKENYKIGVTRGKLHIDTNYNLKAIVGEAKVTNLVQEKDSPRKWTSISTKGAVCFGKCPDGVEAQKAVTISPHKEDKNARLYVGEEADVNIVFKDGSSLLCKSLTCSSSIVPGSIRTQRGSSIIFQAGSGAPVSIIGAASGCPYSTYTVKEGDTLGKISDTIYKKCGVRVQPYELAKTNKLWNQQRKYGDLIYPGEKLNINIPKKAKIMVEITAAGTIDGASGVSASGKFNYDSKIKTRGITPRNIQKKEDTISSKIHLLTSDILKSNDKIRRLEPTTYGITAKRRLIKQRNSKQQDLMTYCLLYPNKCDENAKKSLKTFKPYELNMNFCLGCDNSHTVENVDTLQNLQSQSSLLLNKNGDYVFAVTVKDKKLILMVKEDGKVVLRDNSRKEKPLCVDGPYLFDKDYLVKYVHKNNKFVLTSEPCNS